MFQLCFNSAFGNRKKNVHTKKSGDLLVFWCKNYSCSSSPSWPVTGGIVPMPHRLPKEQTAAIVGSVESVEKVLLGMQDMFGKPSCVKGQAVRIGLLLIKTR